MRAVGVEEPPNSLLFNTFFCSGDLLLPLERQKGTMGDDWEVAGTGDTALSTFTKDTAVLKWTCIH